SDEAVTEISKILNDNNVKKVVKSKSMVSEEIGLNNALEKQGIETIETDLGEFIIQTSGEKPYHIVTPAMHKSKNDIAELFNKKFGTDKNATAEELTDFVRKKLRKEFKNAGAGITGANFLISDTGSVALTENEGNGMMSTAFPKIHIVIAGIEKVIPSINDLHLLWPLLSTYGTGQKITVYNSIISGPKKDFEVDGPEKMFVVILDNKRSDIVNNSEIKKSLTCIKCGACLNACPVYKNIGGHTYNVTYSGPIGAVISPYINGIKEYGHLSFACTLCGKCTEICPVKIPLTDLLLINRREYIDNEYNSKSENIINNIFKKIMLKVWPLDFFSINIKNIAMKLFFKKSWGSLRELPKVKEKSFRQQWRDKNKI
ncbi:MAG: lactate utilization protein B, partial [Bacteroidota bacterium]|nr:lactate utilization protein B [Bacteroidota bacterium]